jgi:hypothetical protein
VVPQILLDNRRRRLAHWAPGIVLAAILVSLPALVRSDEPPLARRIGPADTFFNLGFKFNGASTCSSVDCHGHGLSPDGTARVLADSAYTLWSLDGTADELPDPHHSAFSRLASARGRSISQAMNLDNASAIEVCSSCHAAAPPAALRTSSFHLSEGVSCDECHGPSGESVATAQKGWGDLHQKKGWAQAQRRNSAPGALLQQFGFHDNRALLHRARRCVECHLTTSSELVAAGHPPPGFELCWFSRMYPNRHWSDPADHYFEVRLWAAGQLAALEQELLQLAGLAEAGASDREVVIAYNRAMAYYTVFSPLFSTGAVKGSIADAARQLTLARGALVGRARRGELAGAARAGASALMTVDAAVEACNPDRASTMKMLAAILGQAHTPDTLGGFGVEQQRDAIFALYNAYASSADAEKSAADTRGFVGQSLFPINERFQIVPATELAEEREKNRQYKAALLAVKAKLKLP